MGEKRNRKIATLEALVEKQSQVIEAMGSQMETKDCLIERMQQQIETLQRLLYGKKTECQHQETDVGRPERMPRKSSSPPNRNGRAKIPSHIERKPVVYELPKDEQVCDHCGGDLHCIGKETSEQLEYEPARLIVKEHQRCKYGCRHCKRGIKTALMPDQPIDKGLPGPGLLSEIIISKYQDALPLYRQERRWERLGYVIPRSTQCDWVAECAFILKPIVDRMRVDCLRSIKIHTDDTPFYVQQPEKVHTGRFWVYVGGDGRAPPCTLYEYSRSRSKEVPQKFFKKYHGYLQADAYPGYDNLYADGSIIEVGCWAHARRKYIEVLEAGQSTVLAQKAIDFIGQLYGIERQAKPYNTEQKHALRKHYAKPVLKRFRRWLKKTAKRQLPKSPIGKAVAYSLNHWLALNNYLRNGCLEIDNNAAERAIKPVVIGRKNYLFAGSHQAAEDAAVLYSIIETCKQLHINTFMYLQDVLTRLPSTLAKDIDSLLPYHWKPTMESGPVPDTT